MWWAQILPHAWIRASRTTDKCPTHPEYVLWSQWALWPVDTMTDAENDWWRGCEVNVISYVSQLLLSLVAHLSLLAHPVCDIPAGSFPTKSFCVQTYIYSFTPLLILFSPFDQNEKWQPVLQTSDLLKLGNVRTLPAAFSQRWFTLFTVQESMSLISPITGSDEPQVKFKTGPWAAASVHLIHINLECVKLSDNTFLDPPNSSTYMHT